MRASTLSRLDLLEQNHGPQGQDVHVIVLRGPGRTAVLPDRFVCSDGRIWRREPNETLEQFESRAVEEAERGATRVVLLGPEFD
jgi:hypothetical protein